MSILQDHYDVKMPCHLLLTKVASKAGSHVLAALDSLCKPLEKTLTARVKTDAVKQEVRWVTVGIIPVLASNLLKLIRASL